MNASINTRLGVLPPPADPAVAAGFRPVRVAGLALAYFLLTLPALLLTSVPSYALPLWPAAGLALAALAVWGWRLWPGIWVGAFAAEWLHQMQLTVTFDASACLAQTALIASGDALQAVLGALLVRRFLRAAEPLATLRDALAFLALGGPLACLTAPTVGVVALHFFGGLATTATGLTWITWWVGDSLGVLLFAPLTLLVLPESRRHWRGHIASIAAPIMAIGVLAMVGYLWVISAERAEQRALLVTKGNDLQNRLENVLYQRRERLRTIEGLFEVHEQVTTEEFAAFNRLAEARSGVEIIEWAPRVTQAGRADFEAAARRAGREDFALTELGTDYAMAPAAPRADYFPLWFASSVGAHPPFGFDFAASAANRTAMQRAAETTLPALVAREALFYRDPLAHSWRLLVPVYRSGFTAKDADAAARREALRGFAIGVINPVELWANEIAHVASEGLDFRIVALADWNRGQPLLIGAPAAADEKRPVWSAVMDNFAGPGLRLEVWSREQATTGQSAMAKVYFAGSLLAVLLTSLAAFVAAGNRRRLARDLAQRTANENRLNALFDSVQVGVIVHDTQAVIVSVNVVAEQMLQLDAANLVGRKTRDAGWRFLAEDGSRMPAENYPGNQVLVHQQPVKDIVVGVTLPRGQSVLWMLVSAAPIFDAEQKLSEVAVTFMDITVRRRLEQWERERAGIMEALSADVPLAEVLQRITRAVEAEDRRALCSILLLDESGKRLVHGAAPSLPDFYVQAIDGVEIGPEVGSCGTAAFTGRRVIVADIASHPYWKDFRDLAARAGLAACWSEPILTADGRVLGTFAIYLREPGEPGAEDFNRMRLATALARLAIEQSQARAAVVLEGNKLAAAFDNASMGIVLANPQGGDIEMNATALRFHGYQSLDEMHRRLDDYADEWELRYPDGRRMPFNEWPLARAVRGEFMRDAEVHYLHLPTGYRWICNITCVPVRDSQGTTALIVLTLLDISGQVRTAHELQQLNADLEQRVIDRTAALSEAGERIAAILATVVDGVITIDERGTVETFNPAAERIFGYAAGEVVGQNIRMLMPEPYHGEHDGYLEHYLETGEARVIGKGREVAGRRKDGSVFPLDLAVSEMHQGTERRFTGVVRDITERKAGERATRYLQEAVQAIPEGFAIFDAEDRLTLWNGRYADLYGIDAADAYVGKSFETFLREGLARGNFVAALGREEAWLAERLHAHRNPGAPFDQQLPDGRWLRISEVRLSDGSIAGMRTDITELKRAQAAQEDARAAAEAANRAKSEFLATMSHEIRTPMNGVIGMVDVLQQTSLQGYQSEMVDTIRDSAYSLLGIIEDILDFSKIEAGKLEVECLPTSVAEVVEKACGMLDHLAVRKNVDLTLFTDPALPALVQGDAQRLRQIIINLANNAIKFSSGLSRPGQVSVRAVLAERRPDGIVVNISVTDNGIGMDAETQTRLFTAFSQADASTTRRFGGTGLGLSIARNLAGLMGGDIVVQSAPGEGSSFTLRLPGLQIADSQALDAIRGADTVPSSAVTGLRCLVVGDADSLAEDWAAYLDADGAQVERATDLASAREHATPAGPGPWLWLIDADHHATESDGLQAMFAARTIDDLRVLVIARGKRRRLRQPVAELPLWEVDANALTRQRLLKTAAIVAGRLSAEEVPTAGGKSAAALAAPARADALKQGRLILIAEDNETNQKVIVQQLALLGFAADVAGDGREALARWQSGDYALLLTDLHMPHMDGFELTASIRAEENGTRRMPIIALTANALRGEALRCLDAGMDDYLSKPTPLAELKAILEKWLPVAVSPAPTSVAPVDVSVLAALVGDDPATIREFLMDFRASATSIAAELATACAAGDTTQATALAHKLKSSARSVGAMALGELCAELEATGNAGQADALPDLIQRFEAEMAAVEACLESLT
jgi:PAS domain S-box-containing protein